jgi:hypothetical protein
MMMMMIEMIDGKNEGTNPRVVPSTLINH